MLLPRLPSWDLKLEAIHPLFQLHERNSAAPSNIGYDMIWPRPIPCAFNLDRTCIITGNVTQALKLQFSTVGIWKLYQKNGFPLDGGILSGPRIICKETKSGMGRKKKMGDLKWCQSLTKDPSAMSWAFPPLDPPSSWLSGGSGSCSGNSSGKEASTCNPAG